MHRADRIRSGFAAELELQAAQELAQELGAPVDLMTCPRHRRILFVGDVCPLCGLLGHRWKPGPP